MERNQDADTRTAHGQIERYRKRGGYANEFREARRELMAKRQAKKVLREGNFLKEGGRLIYDPK